MKNPKIALISATPLAIAPAAAAITEAFPDGTVWNLLDDRLLSDAHAEGSITESLAARMDTLIESALAGGADGVLLTCSQYGVRAEVRDAAHDGVAVLSPDGPLFAATVAQRPARVLLVASLEGSAVDSTERLSVAFASAGATTEIRALVVSGAAKPLPADQLSDLLAGAVAGAVTEAAAEGDANYDVIVLAQFSLAPAAGAIADRVGIPVLDGPRTAAQRLVAEIEGHKS